MSISNKKINISTTGDIYSINYSMSLNDNLSLVCMYLNSNPNKLIDNACMKYIDNIILANGYCDISTLLDYKSNIPFNVIYNLFNDSENNTLSEDIFKNCNTLYSVSQIPDNFRIIKDNAFNGCYNLYNINLNNITNLKDSVFEGCKMLKSIDVSNIIELGKRTFAGTSIKTINLNNSITELPPFLFAECTNLKSFNFNNSLTVYEGVFSGCTSLTSVYISNFSGAVSNDSDTFTEEVTDDNLNQPTDPDIPPQPPQVPNLDPPNLNYGNDNDNNQILKPYILPNYLFAGCKKLNVGSNAYVSFIDNIKVIGVGSLMNCLSLVTFRNPGEEDNPIQYINKYGFKDCLNLEEIDLSSCDFIDDFGFKNCQSLRELNLNSLTSFNCESVFENCINLRTINEINNDLSDIIIGKKYFKNCKSLSLLELGFGDNSIFNKVSEIKDQAFYGCKSLGLDNSSDILEYDTIYGKTINIVTIDSLDNETTSVDDSNNLIADHISDENGDIQIFNSGNDNENNNPEVNLDLSNVDKIGDYAFGNCYSLTNVIFKSEVELGIGAFINCISLKNITLPSGVTNLSQKLFMNCSSLKTLTFTSAITGDIELSGISDCNKIKSISMPSGKYKTIDNKCIVDTETNTIIYVVKDISLLEINADDNITNIDDNAFNNSNISILNLSNDDVNAPNINEKTFANINNYNFHILMKKTDPKYRRYINILGKNKIYTV